MGYFIPQYIQKRVLRYAISRLELVDTDALDLDRLDIAWGQRSTLELRDVGLRLEKLTSLLKLPSTFELTKARILLLRLTIPADIYSSGISVEVEGVNATLRLPSGGRENHGGSRKSGLSKGVKANRPRSTQPAVHDPGGRDPEVENSEDALPTTTDLAKSFLQSEPKQEREELEAAIVSQSQYGSSSSTQSEDGDEELGAGTAGVSLPSFIANFLQGVVDRLQVKIKDVTLSVDLDVPRDTESSRHSKVTDSITAQLCIQNLAIEGVTTNIEAETSKLGKRLISLQHVQAMLISDPMVFAKYSSLSVPASPIAMHSKIARSHADSSPSKSSSTLSSAGLAMTHSIILEGNRGSRETDEPIALEESSYTNDGRFSDAGTDADHELSQSTSDASGLDASRFQDSVLDNPSYLDQVLDQDDSLEDSTNLASASQASSGGVPINQNSRTGLQLSVLGSSSSSSLASSPIVDQLPSPSGAQSHASIDNKNSAILNTQSKSYHITEATDVSGELGGASPLRGGSPHSEKSASRMHSRGSPEEDLTESRIFTHEEAESMYMSAISHTSSAHGEGMRIPGAWDDFTPGNSPPRKFLTSAHGHPEDILDERCSTPTPQEPLVASVIRASEMGTLPKATLVVQSGTPADRALEDQENVSASPHSSDTLSRLAKPVLFADKISIWLPSDEAGTIDEPHAEESPRSVTGKGPSPSSPRTAQTVDHSRTNRPRLHSRDSSTSINVGLPSPRFPADEHHTDFQSPVQKEGITDMDISTVSVQFDISIGWLMAKILQKLSFLWMSDSEETDSLKVEPKQGGPINFAVQSVSICFLEHLRGQVCSPSVMSNLKIQKSLATDSDVLLRLLLSNLDFTMAPSQGVTTTQLNIAKFVFGFASEDIISFNAGMKMRESTRDMLSPTRGDISLSLKTSKDAGYADLTTLPLHLSLNIQKLDEIFGWFGGLSGILELGSSIASMSTITGGSPKAGRTLKRPRGVRFESTPKPSGGSMIGSDFLSPAKANVRVGGLVVDVIGRDCRVKLETSAVKIVNRPELTGIQVDKAKVTGPHRSEEDTDTPVNVDVINTRVEYLFTPEEKDLARLLSLLTPSKSKYEEDDDIMLDTLFRQRRQGPVLRISVEGVKTFLVQSAEIDLLPKLAKEMTALSKVAKYLPEDDRPGLLTLAKIRELDAEVMLQAPIGTLRLQAQGLGAAHVNIPSLIAFKADSLSLNQNSANTLLQSCLPQKFRTPDLPMIMGRFIADEMDPTVKVKLYNIQTEYTVPTAMAILGLTDSMTAEDFAINMVASVIDLAERSPAPPIKTVPSQSSASSDSSVGSCKTFKLSVTLRDSVIGLNPRDLDSKGLLVLTHAQVSVALHKESEFETSFNIKKGSLMVVDDVRNLKDPDQLPKRSTTAVHDSQVDGLTQMGYIQVGYASSALAVLRMMQLEPDGEKSMDVELKDFFIYLETCADSTQTLLSVLHGLSPPTPPSKALKYRTEVMPIQDLLASMTGNAFLTNETADELEYDIPEAIEEEPEEDDDSPHDLGIESAYYTSEHGDGDEDLNTSMIEEQMLESTRLSDAPVKNPQIVNRPMLESFHSQRQEDLAASALDFQEDHFASKSSVGGTAHRWNSSQNTYNLTNEVKLKGSPLRVRVRNVHFIWNLYDGYDWQKTQEAISKAVKDVETRATERRALSGRRLSRDFDEEEEESVIGDFLFNSIYIGIPANRDPRELSHNINHGLDDLVSETGSYATTATVTARSPSRQAQGPKSRGKRLRLNRSRSHKMSFELKGISADLVVFPPGSGETQSSLDVRVSDLKIFDNVPSSTWKMFAMYMGDPHEKEDGVPMIHLEILSVKPIAELAASELILKATILPLRLHVDQDALDFLSRFFEFKDPNAPIHTSTSDIPFIQRAEINNVVVKLDFKPKRVDYAGLRSGRTTEFMNFFVLDEADMVLRHVIIYGVSGFDKLGKTLNDIWMPDVKRNQLPGVLAGIAPIRSLVNVGSGVKDLVVIPMREYKKDGRVVRSIQKGAFAFAKTTTSELVKLGAKLAIGTQTVLQGAEDYLSARNPSASTSSHDGNAAFSPYEDDDDPEERKQISAYADQPLTVAAGLRGAYASLERDLLLAKDAIVAVPGEVLESGSAGQAARAVMRRAPTVILRPALGVSKAVGMTLMGAAGSLDGGLRRRVDDKYKKH